MQAAKSAKQKVFCNCISSNQLQLAIKKCGDRLVLAKYPKTGPLHSDECDDFPIGDSLSGIGGYDKNAAQKTDKGYALRLGVSLQRTSGELGDKGLRDHDANPSKKLARLGLYGFLHFLWNNSRLNFWSGNANEKNMKWNSVARRLEKSLQIMTSNNLEMGTLVVLPRTINGDQVKRQLAEIKQKQKFQKIVKLRIIIGNLISVKEKEFGIAIEVEDMKEYFYMGKDEWAQAVISCRYPAKSRVMKEIEEQKYNARSERVVIIGRFENNINENLKLIDLVLMVTSKDFIPVDSGYERQLCDHMVSANRQFEKPLIYDQEYGQFPDFILNDVEEILPMEVWGLDDPEYNKRKMEKIEEYKKKGGVWEWSPNKESIPALPPIF